MEAAGGRPAGDLARAGNRPDPDVAAAQVRLLPVGNADGTGNDDLAPVLGAHDERFFRRAGTFLPNNHRRIEMIHAVFKLDRLRAKGTSAQHIGKRRNR